MRQEDKCQPFFTDSIVVNFLILVIPSLPGIIVYLLGKEMAGDLWLGQFPVAIGLLALLLCSPLTLKIVNKIRASALGGKG